MFTAWGLRCIDYMNLKVNWQIRPNLEHVKETDKLDLIRTNLPVFMYFWLL
jgi:hypothetical protein